MTFSEWLKSEALSCVEIDNFIRHSLPSIGWPSEKLTLKDVIDHLKSSGVDFTIWSSILKYWVLYLKHESNSRIINANEIREIREVLMSILESIHNNQSELEFSHARIISDAENQIALLEEKEVEIRHLQNKIVEY
jgi:hypothetical protein